MSTPVAVARRPRLLIVGFIASVHIARYLDLLRDGPWEIHVFDVVPRPDPRGDYGVPMTAYLAHDEGQADLGEDVTVVVDPDRGSGFEGRAAHLARVIRELEPDVVHTHELAISGRVAHDAHERLGGFGAPWLATNWGSDLFWNGRLPRVVPHLRATLSTVDYYAAECHRDLALARAFGFRGAALGVWPVAGGIDLAAVAGLRTPGPTSARRAIALKGVGGFYGGAEAGLTAIERCGSLLAGWEICGYQMAVDLVERVEALAAAIGAHYTHLSGAALRDSPHDAVLAMHGRARVSLGLNRTDALSTSFLEAVAMGALPLQGHGSCGYELTPAGRGALFVDARDPDAITDALRLALTDDELVDGAAALNARVAAQQLDRRRIAARVHDGYERIMSEGLVSTR